MISKASTRHIPHHLPDVPPSKTHLTEPNPVPTTDNSLHADWRVTAGTRPFNHFPGVSRCLLGSPKSPQPLSPFLLPYLFHGFSASLLHTPLVRLYIPFFLYIPLLICFLPIMHVRLRYSMGVGGWLCIILLYRLDSNEIGFREG